MAMPLDVNGGMMRAYSHDTAQRRPLITSGNGDSQARVFVHVKEFKRKA
jgi:hypothetical protein